MRFVLTAMWTAKEGEAERVQAALEKLAAASRAELGCLYYQPTRSNDDPRRFLIYEEYVDEDAYKAHGESDHFQRHGLGEAIPLLESRDRAFYTGFVD
jgi:quinol monooxygenase YgiN